MQSAVILLGSNIDADKNIKLAKNSLGKTCKILQESKVYLTKPVGSEGPDFLNQAVLIQADLNKNDLKKHVLRKIEKDLGRVRTKDKYAARTIDLDIILFDGQVIDLAIWKYCFIAIPVSDLLPDLKQANSNRTLGEIASELRCKADINIHPNYQK